MLRDTLLVILNYKRYDNVVYQVNKFKGKLPIAVINNNPDIKLFQIEGAGVFNNSKNLWCIERWRYASTLSIPYVIFLDDDIDPSFHCIMRLRTEIEKTPDRLVSIYGRSGISECTRYEDLKSYWCVDAEVELAVGACLAVSVPHLKNIWDTYLKGWSFDRGDDIQVSLSMFDYYKKPHRTVKTEVRLLEEGDVGLNKDPAHFTKRWEVIRNFRSPFPASEN